MLPSQTIFIQLYFTGKLKCAKKDLNASFTVSQWTLASYWVLLPSTAPTETHTRIK